MNAQRSAANAETMSFIVLIAVVRLNFATSKLVRQAYACASSAAFYWGFGGPPCRVRTCGLAIRNRALYPAELRAVIDELGLTRIRHHSKQERAGNKSRWQLFRAMVRVKASGITRGLLGRICLKVWAWEKILPFLVAANILKLHTLPVNS